jgi:hypothetical protein
MTQRRPAATAGRLSVHPTRRRVRGALVLQQLGDGRSTHTTRPILEGTSIRTSRRPPASIRSRLCCSRTSAAWARSTSPSGVAGLVPPHHPGAAGAGVPGRHPRPGRRLQAGKGGHGGLNGGLGLLPLTVPEVRRLLVALVWTRPVGPGLVLAWSRWRRRHQARARRAHYQRRESNWGWGVRRWS